MVSVDEPSVPVVADGSVEVADHSIQSTDDNIQAIDDNIQAIDDNIQVAAVAPDDVCELPEQLAEINLNEAAEV